jgi:formylmethanofuran dehydrogenase subunit E
MPVSRHRMKIMADILSYNFDEYVKMVTSFHGSPAPGVLIGGYMVDHAYRNLPEGGTYDVICETAKCLPDAVQLLTPCSIGNRWLKIVDVGRYALTFYDKRSGKGVRVYLDWTLLDRWPGIKGWYLKLTPKEEQDEDSLRKEIREAGTDLCSIEKVEIRFDQRSKARSSAISICPSCNEAYRTADGAVCPACKGGVLPYARLGDVVFISVKRQASA